MPRITIGAKTLALMALAAVVYTGHMALTVRQQPAVDVEEHQAEKAQLSEFVFEDLPASSPMANAAIVLQKPQQTEFKPELRGRHADGEGGNAAPPPGPQAQELVLAAANGVLSRLENPAPAQADVIFQDKDVDYIADSGARGDMTNDPDNTAHGQEGNMAELGLDGLEIKGIDLLRQMGIAIPAREFDYDDSDESKAKRMKAKIEGYMTQGNPEQLAHMRASLHERELQSKKARAIHNQKRAVIRLIQEAKLKKDAVERDLRLQLLQAKQQISKEQLEEDAKARVEADRKREEERRQRDKEAAEDRRKLEEQRALINELREADISRMMAESEARKQDEKERKAQEFKQREEAALNDAETKRKMLESFQAEMAAQMEENKRLAREERLQEAQRAREARLGAESALNLNKRPIDLLGADGLAFGGLPAARAP